MCTSSVLRPYIYMYVYVCMYVCMYIYIDLYIYINMYIYIAFTDVRVDRAPAAGAAARPPRRRPAGSTASSAVVAPADGAAGGGRARSICSRSAATATMCLARGTVYRSSTVEISAGRPARASA